MAHILLVEDNLGDVDLLQECFREIGAEHRIEVAQDGDEALAVLLAPDAQRPDLIILDLNLPIKTGHEVLEVIKRSPTLKRLPVIVLTGSAASGDIIRAYESHANAYFQKPGDYEALVDLVAVISRFWLSAKLPSQVSVRE